MTCAGGWKGSRSCARRLGFAERLTRWCRRNPAVAGLVVAVTIVLMAGTLISSYFAVEAERKALEAGVEKQRADQHAKQARAEQIRASEKAAEAGASAIQERKERERADREADRARQQKLKSDHFLYGASINLTQRAWEEGRYRRFEELLESLRPDNPATPPGWEWNYLDRLSSPAWRLTFKGPAKPRTITLSPDGSLIAIGHQDGQVTVWDTEQRQRLVSFKSGDKVALGLAFSPDKGRLSSVFVDEAGRADQVRIRQTTLTVWSLSRQQAEWSEDRAAKWPAQKTPGAGHPALSFSADGTRLAANGTADDVIIWDVAKGQALRTFESTGYASAVAFSPDGKSIAVGASSGGLTIWNTTSGVRLVNQSLRFGFGTVFSLVHSLDGGQLYAAGNRQMVQAFDLGTGREQLTFEVDSYSRAIPQVVLSPDARLLALTPYKSATYASMLDPDKAVKIYDIAKRSEILTLGGQAKQVTGLSFSPGGKRLAAAVGEQVKVWDIDLPQESVTIDWELRSSRDLPIIEVLGPNAGLLAAVFASSKVGSVAFQIYDFTTKQRRFSVDAPDDQLSGEAVFSGDGSRLASIGKQKVVSLWDTATGRVVSTLDRLKNIGEVSSLALSSDGERLATWNPSALTVDIWDTTTGERTLALQGHLEANTRIAFSPAGTRLAAVGNSSATVWATESGHKLWRLEDPAPPDSFEEGAGPAEIRLAFSPDGTRLAAGFRDGAVRVWDAAEGRDPFLFKGHTDKTTCLTFSPDGTRLVTGSEDATVKVWDVFTGQELLTLKGHNAEVRGVAFSPDGMRLVSVDHLGKVRIWDGSPVR